MWGCVTDTSFINPINAVPTISFHGDSDMTIPIDTGTFKYCTNPRSCLLYTSDAADERSSVDLGGRRIIKKKKRKEKKKIKKRNKKKQKQCKYRQRKGNRRRVSRRSRCKRTINTTQTKRKIRIEK